MVKLLELLDGPMEKAQRYFSTIVKLIIVFSMFHATYFHLWHILFADVFLFILLFMPYFLRKSYSIQIPREFEFMILLFVVLTFFLGDIRGVIIQLAFGVAVGFAGFAILLILFAHSDLKTNYLLVILFSSSVAITLGLLAEMIKFYLKLQMNYDFGVGDYSYAMRSLSFVAFGAALSAIIGYAYMKGHRASILKDFVGRFKRKNPNFFVERTDSPDEVIGLIKRGEGEKVEFKSTLRTNLSSLEHDKKIENTALKTIAAFLNSEGGNLVVGVSDNGKIEGIEKDAFESNDKFLRHFMNLFKERIGNEFLPFIKSELILIEGKYVFLVSCMKSEKPAFLKFGGQEEFYVRVGASTLKIDGSKLIDYIQGKFYK
ncbi:MAG: ATP-binding protein [Nanoarchaeota archaeon]